MHGAASQMNRAGANLDEEARIQRFQAHRFHRKEIARQQLLLMLAQKGSPGVPPTQDDDKRDPIIPRLAGEG